MITGELKNQIDRLWLEFWQGGIANPLTVIEQITFLMFTRLLDINEKRDERRAKHTGQEFKHRFGNSQQHLRWSDLIHVEDPERLHTLVRDDVFKHIREHDKDNRFGDYMKDARLVIDKPGLLQKAVRMINKLPLESGDTKGDLYEYLLSKLTTAGINGQFRTPRHIIKLMVRMLDPKPDEMVADPACGTAGFLVAVLEYLLETYTSPEGVIRETVTLENGKTEEQCIYTGDKLDQSQWAHIRGHMFHGFDFDATMLRIAAMNLYMHGAEDPDIHYQDTLAQSFAEKFPQAERNGFNLILANPPFKGSLDQDTINPAILRMVKTKKTELLFVAQILRMLKTGGRSATIVPQGVLFGSSTAHRELRRLLIEDNQLEAVINLPSGVFRPYAGVATAILLFAKGGTTDNVWFYDLEDDGFSLDDKRDRLYGSDFAGDLPKVLAAWRARDTKAARGKANDRGAAHFWVGKGDIVENKYDLSINRYKVVVHEEAQYEAPMEILKKMRMLEVDILNEMEELERML
jgi:type I restriction enzyme M protein